MVGVRHTYAAIAEAELKRRGTKLPTVEVSGHALDRASQQCLDLWQRDTKNGEREGLNAWLTRLFEEALRQGVREGRDRIHYRRMCFVVQEEYMWPVLVTVMRKNRGIF
jgi:hypothetical protein